MENTTTRWPKHAVWLGLLITLFGMLSYFTYFLFYVALRDFPVLNLPIVIIGVLISIVGCWKYFPQATSMLGKSLAGFSLLLTFGLAGLFYFYIFIYSYQLPESANAPKSGDAAPDFTLIDQQSKEVSLSDLRGKNVVLVFYRGNW